MLIAQKRLKLWTSNLAFNCSQGQSGHDSQKFIQMGAWLASRDPLNFSASNANTWRRYALSWAPSSYYYCRCLSGYLHHSRCRWWSVIACWTSCGRQTAVGRFESLIILHINEVTIRLNPVVTTERSVDRITSTECCQLANRIESALRGWKIKEKAIRIATKT